MAIQHPIPLPTRVRMAALGRAILAWRRVTYRGRRRRAPAGAPILLVARKGFERYTAELLRAEGVFPFREGRPRDLVRISSATRAVIVGSTLSRRHVRRLEAWVRAGGTLLMLRPRGRLVGLAGLRERRGHLAHGWLAGAPAGPLASLGPIRLRGRASLYDTIEADSIAALSREPDAAPASCGVSLRKVGAGSVVAFAIDVPGSVAVTRQGELGTTRAAKGEPSRTWDLIGPPPARGAASDGWASPDADRLQRLLVRALLYSTNDPMPLPQLWHLPDGHRAVVVLTGDDHGKGDVTRRFGRHASADEKNRVRSTCYSLLGSRLTDAEAVAWTRKGFEVALHLATRCAGFSAPRLAYHLETQLRAWRRKFPSLPSPTTLRTHCVAWSGWSMVPKVERLFGIRLDLNYYPYPAPWPDGVASLFTGSALPMRFADRRGRPIDVFQLATVVTDESGQRAGVAIGELLDRALGTSGWPAVLCVNAHTDVGPGERVSDEVVAASLERGVPLVAANSMLEWIDAREACLVRNIRWGGGALSFELRVDPRAGGRLRLILPARVGLDRTLVSVERGGRRVDASTIDLEGLEYAMFDGVSGTYTARFVPSPVVVHAGVPRTAS